MCGWCSGASGTYFSSAATYRRIDAHGLRVLGSAVHDPVPDADEPVLGEPLAQERDQVIERAGVAERDAVAPRLLVDDVAPSPSLATNRGDVYNALGLPARDEREAVARFRRTART